MVLQVVPWRDTRCQVITTIFQTFQVPRVSVVEFLGDQRFQWSGGCYTLPKSTRKQKPLKMDEHGPSNCPRRKRMIVFLCHPFSGADLLLVSGRVYCRILFPELASTVFEAPAPSIRTTDEDSVPWFGFQTQVQGPHESWRCRPFLCLVETLVSFGVVFWIPKGLGGFRFSCPWVEKSRQKCENPPEIFTL